jgi:hypothetical protein
MSAMTPAQTAAILAFAIAALAGAYVLIMWLADRAIDALDDDAPEPRVRVRVTRRARCSSAPDLGRWELAAVVGTVLLLGAIALLSCTWMGQELLEYVARVLLARPN